MENKILSTTDFYIKPLDIVVQDNFNSRKDFGNIDMLAKQIIENGQLNPIAVVETTINGQTKFRLVDGERRYRAIMKAINDGHRIDKVKVTILPNDISNEDMLMQQYIRNEQQSFNEYEKAILCQKLRNEGLNNAQIAKKLSLNIGVVSYCFKHLERDSRVQDLLAKGVISGSEVRRIYQSHNHDEESAVADIIETYERIKQQGKTTITSKDIKANAKTRLIKDTTAIKKALPLLLKYLEEYKDNNGKLKFKLKLSKLSNKLKGRNSDLLTIRDILDEMVLEEEMTKSA